MAYSRTILGLYWIVLLPLFYVAVFIGVRFFALERGARQWLPGEATPDATLWQAFAIVIGLIVFWSAIEPLTRSPTCVRKNASLVTDLNFPVEVLPWVTVGLAVFNFLVRYFLMGIAYCVLIGMPNWEIILAPLVVVPLLVTMVGVSYLFGAIGVFVADLEYVIQVLMTALLLLSGVLFPLSVVPEFYRWWLYLNPIAYVIRDARALILYGEPAAWLGLGTMLAIGLVLMGLGYWVFSRLRSRFSDAL